MPRHRYTVSLVVTGRVATEIDGMRRALGADALRRIPPHVTVIPPLNVPDEAADDVWSVLRTAGAATRPIAADLGPPATFWPDNPVVYLEVHTGAEAVAALRQRLATGPLAPPAGRRELPFVPHVTLDQRIDPERIPPALSVLGSYREHTVFERVTLLEQDADHIWHPVGDVALEAPAVVGRGGLPLELSRSERPDPAAAAWAADAWTTYLLDVRGPEWPPDRSFAVTGRRDGTVVGVATGETRGEVCELSRLIVDPAVRGEGVGRQLLREVEGLAVDRGCRRVRLRTADSGPAEGFYADRGYLRTAALPAWRGERDFVVMERLVGPPPA